MCVVVVARRAIAIIVDFVARRAVATVVVVGRRRHRVAPSPVVPSSAYVGYLSSTLFFLLTCILCTVRTRHFVLACIHFNHLMNKKSSRNGL